MKTPNRHFEHITVLWRAVITKALPGLSIKLVLPKRNVEIWLFRETFKGFVDRSSGNKEYS